MKSELRIPGVSSAASIMSAVFISTVVLQITSQATTYWVATDGNDSNPGTSNQPFATPQKAVTLPALVAGDTIYVRDGTYSLSTEVKPTKAGTAGNLCKLWAEEK